MFRQMFVAQFTSRPLSHWRRLHWNQREVAAADALWRRLPAGGDVAPLLLPSCFGSARPQLFILRGEIITRHQAPGPDIHRSEKQSERARERERERPRRAERIRWSDAHGEGKRPEPALLRRLPGPSVLTAESALLWLDLAGFGLVVGCGLVLTAVIVRLPPPPPPTE